MRLLRLGDGDEVSLVEYTQSSIPPYAILSHTWNEEEVTFRDMIEGTGKDKRGYAKIRLVARLTRLDGLEHFWIDTCCIDKSSRAELSEALNSMFR
jgi:hypothetical protein